MRLRGREMCRHHQGMLAKPLELIRKEAEMQDLAGKVAVITGAASGIGRGMTESFVSAGMRVVLADVEEDVLRKTTKTPR